MFCLLHWTHFFLLILEFRTDQHLNLFKSYPADLFFIIKGKCVELGVIPVVFIIWFTLRHLNTTELHLKLFSSLVFQLYSYPFFCIVALTFLSELILFTFIAFCQIFLFFKLKTEANRHANRLADTSAIEIKNNAVFHCDKKRQVT